MDQQLAEINQQINDIRGLEDERRLLGQLSTLAARIEQLISDSNFRFSAARAYYDLVLSRLEELREQEVSGLQTFNEFLPRRLTPAYRTCEAISDHLDDLSKRIDRASELLRTRVDLTLEAQNQDLLKPSGGEIIYQGQDLQRIPTHERVKHGLALVPEGRGIFPKLTVAENLRMGAYARSLQVGELEQAYERFPRLFERKEQLAGTLSGGEQQMLAIVRALLSKPKLLLLDEPSMGLAPLMVQKIFETIAEVTKEGVAVLLVEQNAKAALQLAQRAYVMESGKISLEGDAKDLAADPRVRAAYLGE